jgi:hypothetical protein
VAVKPVSRKRSKKSAARGGAALANRWGAAYAALPRARAARSKRVVDARTFAEEAFELPCAWQIGWKATAEGALDELELRFAPAFYLDHELKGRSLHVWREQDDARTGFRLEGKSAKSVELVVSGVATLVGRQAFGLKPLNDGDDLHFVFLEPARVKRLRALLGGALRHALMALTEVRLDGQAGTVTWSDGVGKAKESEIAKVEKAFGIRFPDDYRTFVKTQRGGTPSPQVVKIQGRRSPGVLSSLLNFVPGDDDYILENHDWIKDRLATGVIPIAGDPAGNYICFDFGGKGDPKIVWWEHEVNARKRYLPIAKSFTELLGSLYDEE